VVIIKGNEISKSLREIVSIVRKNPYFSIESLYNAAAIIMTIGLCKNIPTLKVIGNFILSVPSRFRPLLAYRYQLLGDTEELQKLVT